MGYSGKRVAQTSELGVQKVTDEFIRAILISFATGVMVCGIVFICIIVQITRSYHTEITNLKAEIAASDETFKKGVETAVKETRLTCMVQADEIQQEKEAIEQNLNQEIETLRLENQRLTDTLTQFQQEREDDFQLLKRYSYVFELASEDSGITTDLIRHVDELCQAGDVNPHLMWGVYDVESTFNIYADNGNSSARGLGQTLESTARRFWEGVLGHGAGSYNHQMAYDPYVNTEITICMISRNLNQGVNAALDLYGDGTSTYPSRVLNAAKNHGYTITNENCHYPY